MTQGLDLTYLAIVLGSILVCMTLHEAMHGFVANWLGDDTAKLEGRLTLNPLAHIDLVTTVLLPLFLAASGLPPFGAAKPVPFNPARVKFEEFGAALVGIAGPLTNLALAILAGLTLQFVGPELDVVLQKALATFLLVNVSFFVFNLIPFPPLDGSRVLYAFAPDPIQEIMERIESMGFMAIAFFMLLFFAFLREPFGQVVYWVANFLAG